ncbi:hypothetical protein RhiJN_01681 [Ceratobasidium sp. AG-Ba]|nr:hypothetical protein RhiJN_01681 [Ceratobasidium sp. AG-Ba]QRW02607.1 hypothetical protein RhiLY_01606 [Ceratobasidium sp. AG-Ba]
MGQSLTVVRDFLTSGDKKAKDDVLQQLLFLVNAADARLDKYESELKQDFLTNSVAGKTAIPGLRALRWERGYRVGVGRQATKGIGEIVDSFFGGSGEPDETLPNPTGTGATGTNSTGGQPGTKQTKWEDPKVTGFKKVVELALDVFLGNATVGQQEMKKFFIFVHHNAIVRIDVKLWRYNFQGRGVMAEADNVLAYIACTSVVKHDALEIDELVYLLSEHAGDENVNAYLAFLIYTWNNMKAIAKDPTRGASLPPIPKKHQVEIPSDDEMLIGLENEAPNSNIGLANNAAAGTSPGGNPEDKGHQQEDHGEELRHGELQGHDEGDD